jgi:hypothetical protein
MLGISECLLTLTGQRSGGAAGEARGMIKSRGSVATTLHDGAEFQAAMPLRRKSTGAGLQGTPGPVLTTLKCTKYIMVVFWVAKRPLRTYVPPAAEINLKVIS